MGLLTWKVRQNRHTQPKQGKTGLCSCSCWSLTPIPRLFVHLERKQGGQSFMCKASSRERWSFKSSLFTQLISIHKRCYSLSQNPIVAEWAFWAGMHHSFSSWVELWSSSLWAVMFPHSTLEPINECGRSCSASCNSWKLNKSTVPWQGIHQFMFISSQVQLVSI